MNEHKIKSLIHERGATLTAIADGAGVTLSTVCRVIKGASKSRRIASAIALYVGQPVDVLWPGKYPKIYSRKSAAQVEMEIAAAFKAVNRMRSAA